LDLPVSEIFTKSWESSNLQIVFLYYHETTKSKTKRSRIFLCGITETKLEN